jgi:RimJ/RimL family protein N-acetyltransferase
VIVTDRLVLHSLPPPLVERLVAGDWVGARSLRPPYDITDQTFIGDEHVLALRHAQLTADPTEEPWLLRVGVLKDTRQVVGRVGFHSPPDAAGTVEIGLSVDVPFRRQGFAVELAQALIGWAASQGCTHCLASVRPDNAASLSTITSLGFVKVGEQIDEIDGLEWVHRLDLGGGDGADRLGGRGQSHTHGTDPGLA